MQNRYTVFVTNFFAFLGWNTCYGDNVTASTITGPTGTLTLKFFINVEFADLTDDAATKWKSEFAKFLNTIDPWYTNTTITYLTFNLSTAPPVSPLVTVVNLSFLVNGTLDSQILLNAIKYANLQQQITVTKHIKRQSPWYISMYGLPPNSTNATTTATGLPTTAVPGAVTTPMVSVSPNCTNCRTVMWLIDDVVFDHQNVKIAASLMSVINFLIVIGVTVYFVQQLRKSERYRQVSVLDDEDEEL